MVLIPIYNNNYGMVDGMRCVIAFCVQHNDPRKVDTKEIKTFEM